MKCVFSHKWVILKYQPFCLNELTIKGFIFSFIKLLTIFCTVFMSLLIFINNKKYKSNIQILFDGSIKSEL